MNAPEAVATRMPSENGKLMGLASKYGRSRPKVRPTPTAVPDLMAALEASLAAVGDEKPKKKSGSKASEKEPAKS